MADGTAAGSEGSVRFGVLGSLVAVDGSGTAWPVPAGKQRVLLAALLLGRGRMVSAASLGEALWDGSPPANEPAVLRTYMARLRRVLGQAGPRIVGRPPGWAVELRGPGELDLTEVEHLRLAARAEAGARNWVQASAHLTKALGMWRGEPLVDVPSAVLLRREAGMLSELRVALTEARVDADLRLGRHGELVAELRQLVAEYPLHERFRVQLMLACVGCGQQAAAFEVYRDAYRMLADELGVEPGPELREVHQRILSGDQALAADAPAVVTVGPAVRSDHDDPARSRVADAATGAGSPRGRARSGSPGSWPRESRLAAGLTQQELAERSDGLAEELVAWYRNGHLPPRQRPGQDDSDANGHFDSAAVRARWLPPVVPRQLPVAPRHFVGRRKQLALLGGPTEEAAKAEAAVVVSVAGMAGVGKTSLVLHWAHRVAERFPDGQLFVDLRGFGPAGTPVEPAAALHRFLDGLGVPVDRIPAGLDAQAGLFRSLIAGRRMLLVLDNARDAEQVRPLLPGSPGCLVLVTSRAKLAGLAVGGNAELLGLDLLSAEEAHQLLVSRIPADRAAAEPEVITQLTELCGRLPLALAIAGARAGEQPEFPLAVLTAELRGAARRLDGLDAGDAVTSIRATLSWSYRQLAEPPARMLRLLSVHPGPGITAAAAASLAGNPRRAAVQMLRDLTTASLVTEYLPGRYALHDLVRAFAAEQAGLAEHAEDHRMAVRRMLDHYLHTADAADLMISHKTMWERTRWERDPVVLDTPQPGVTPESFASRGQALAWFAAEHAVLVKITVQAAETGLDVHAWQLARSLEVFVRLRGHWHEQITIQRIAQRAATRLSNQGARAWAHRELGLAFAHSGQFDHAHLNFGRALALYQELGDEEGQTLTRISAAAVSGWLGHHREALEQTLAAVRLQSAPKRSAGNKGLEATLLNNLGYFHARLGELDQARVRCRQALELYRDAGDRYGEAITLDSLAYICHQAGDHAEAVAHYGRAIEQLRQLGAVGTCARVLRGLGESHQAAGDTAAARDARQQAMQILDGMHHPDAELTSAFRVDNR